MNFNLLSFEGVASKQTYCVQQTCPLSPLLVSVLDKKLNLNGSKEKNSLRVSCKIIFQAHFLAFLGIPRIQYNPNAPADDVLCFRHYNADEVRPL